MRVAAVLLTLVLFGVTSVILPFSIENCSLELDQFSSSSLDLHFNMSTFYGGSGEDRGSNVCFDSEGNIIVVGSTLSSDFPVINAHQDTYGGGRDAFLLKLDPLYNVIFSTYYGGSGEDYGYVIAIDDDNNIILAGHTKSNDLSVPNGLQTELGGTGDAYIAKFSPTGTLLYGTYIGGSEADEWITSIDLAENGNWVIVSTTDSDDLNTTTNAFQKDYGGGPRDILLFSLTPDGQDIVFMTYFGLNESDSCTDLTVDNQGNIVLSGYISDISITTTGVYQETFAGGTGDGIIAKISHDGQTLLWSTYLGGSMWDFPSKVAVDSDDSIIISGYTESPDFPLQDELYGNEDMRDTFLAKLSENGTDLVFSSLLGGDSVDYCYGMKMLNNGSVAVICFTRSNNLPTVNAFQENYSGSQDAYFAIYSSDLDSLIFASYLGGDRGETGLSVDTFNDEVIALTGYTSSNDFPLENPLQNEKAGGQDVFLVVLRTPSEEPASTTTPTPTSTPTSTPVQFPIDVLVIGSAVSVIAVVFVSIVYVKKRR